MVLLIDEVDNATNNQVFLDFLAGLRYRYVNRDEIYAFQSVVLAGVTDIKNGKGTIREGENYRENSPWNIAVDFDVDMSFQKAEIAQMLLEYKEERQIELDALGIAGELYAYTAGYPYLVSRLCKLMDEKISQTMEDAWSNDGFLASVRVLLKEKNKFI